MEKRERRVSTARRNMRLTVLTPISEKKSLEIASLISVGFLETSTWRLKNITIQWIPVFTPYTTGLYRLYSDSQILYWIHFHLAELNIKWYAWLILIAPWTTCSNNYGLARKLGLYLHAISINRHSFFGNFKPSKCWRGNALRKQHIVQCPLHTWLFKHCYVENNTWRTKVQHLFQIVASVGSG